MDILKLGFRDIFKNLKIFFIFLIFLSSITLITVSSSLSLVEILFNKKNADNVFFYSVPISKKIETFSNIKNNLDYFFNKGAFSVISVEDINKKIEGINFLAFGKIEKNSDSTVFFIILKENESKINKDKFLIIDEKMLDEDFNLYLKKFLSDDVILLKSKENDYNRILDLNLKDEGIVNLIENTRFKDIDIKNNLDVEFEMIISNSEILFIKHINFDSEFDFIIRYIYVYIFLLIVLFVLFLNIFLKNVYAKLLKEYKIHIICGATKLNIFCRNSIFSIFLVVFCSIIINFLNRFKVNHVFFINIVTNLILFCILEFVILYTLNKQKLDYIGIEGE